MFQGKMNLEDKLGNHIHLQEAAAKTSDVFGVEVELEGQGIEDYTPGVGALWVPHKDDSLRKLAPGDQATEYVFPYPYTMQVTEQALTVLCNFLNSPKCKVYESYRTSIHVHLNFGRETFRTIYNFMTLSLILDELLVSQNGEHRIGNNFCFRAKDALGQVVSLIHSVEQGKDFFHIQANERYSSINFASLMKFGSVEFRSLECTTHLGRIMHWIGTLQQIKEISRTYKNPMDIIQQYSQLGPAAFLTRVLGPFAYKYLNIRERDDMLHSGMRIAQDFAYCSAWNEVTQADWDKQAEEKAVIAKAKAEAQKKKEFIAQEEYNKILDQIKANHLKPLGGLN